MPAPKKGLPVHPLVAALNPDPSKPPRRALKIFGLPGDSPSADETRLWLDADLTSYVDVPAEAILHSTTLSEDRGTILWVDVDAKLSYGSVTSHAAQADFLTGQVTAAHMPGAPGGVPDAAGGVWPTPPVTVFPSQCGACPTHGGPCLSLPFCPSEAMAPSHCAPCPTHGGPCLSLPFCPSEAMAPSHCAPCPTRPPICPPLTLPSGCGPCPTHFWLCPPSHFGPCPTQPPICSPPSWPCPSVHAICPTPTAVVCPSVHTICPSRVCPSVAVPCQTAEACPSAICPQTQACGGPGGGFGPAA